MGGIEMSIYVRNVLNLLALASAALIGALAMPAHSQPAQWNYTAPPGANSLATYPGDVTILGTCTGCGSSTGIFPGNVTIGGTLGVTGLSTLNGGITTGATGPLTVGGSSSFTGLMSGTNLTLSTQIVASTAKFTGLGGPGTSCVTADADGNLQALPGGTCAALGASNTFTAKNTFTGGGASGTVSLKANSIAENVTIVGAAPTATTNFDVMAGSVQYYTANAANNWTLNIRGGNANTLNSNMSVGDSLSFAVLATQGGTAFYNSAVTIDGAAVTPKWQGGAPSSGSINGIDVYTYTVIKLSVTPTWTVLATKTAFN